MISLRVNALSYWIYFPSCAGSSFLIARSMIQEFKSLTHLVGCNVKIPLNSIMLSRGFSLLSTLQFYSLVNEKIIFTHLIWLDMENVISSTLGYHYNNHCSFIALFFFPINNNNNNSILRLRKYFRSLDELFIVVIILRCIATNIGIVWHSFYFCFYFSFDYLKVLFEKTSFYWFWLKRHLKARNTFRKLIKHYYKQFLSFKSCFWHFRSYTKQDHSFVNFKDVCMLNIINVLFFIIPPWIHASIMGFVSNVKCTWGSGKVNER